MENQMAALNVIDFATLTCSSTAALSLADASPALASGKVSGKTVRRMLITAEVTSMRWRADTAAPTAGTGHVLAKDDSISFTGVNYKQLIANIQFFSTAGSACILAITYFD